MIHLREFQAKKIFSDNSIRIPRGLLVRTPDAAAEACERLASAVVIKPQLGVKGRAKAGAIAFADAPEQAREEARRLLSTIVKGERVELLLVEEKVAIEREYYLAATIDYHHRQPVLVASAEGGVDVEEVARTHPEKILRVPVDIRQGPSAQALEPVSQLLGTMAGDWLARLYEIFRRYDAELVEINPLVLTTNDIFMAVDAVLNCDEDALFRQPEMERLMEQFPGGDPIAAAARSFNWTYIDLPGNIGILSSGAGLTMAILDLIHAMGGRAANFLDTAQIDQDGVYEAFDLCQRAKKVNVLLVNFFAGLNRCDHLAEGIRRFIREKPLQAPVVVRLVGNQEETAHRMLREVGIPTFKNLEEAVSRAVRLAEQNTGGAEAGAGHTS
jgi:succinyl-CoA synthetase beta subunit